jgi:formylglycine-generating enzyme required for sulfatase activity/CubicO group peptidase (beta-lactamase class C family)
MIGLLATAAALVSFRDCPGCPEMLAVPAGNFEMGSDESETQAAGLDPFFAARERPQRRVAISAFGLGKTEVTRDQFAAFITASGYRPAPGCFVFEGARWRPDPAASQVSPGFVQASGEPAVCISRADAEAYAAWLSAQTGRSYRLPSEAEWEFAARAGSRTAYPWGDRFVPQGCAIVNGGDRATEARFRWTGTSLGIAQVPPWRAIDCDDGFGATAPAGSLKANAWGFHDMLGNAQEWVADCLNPSHAGAPATGTARRDGDCAKGILKGQGWTGSANVLRPAFRLNGSADERRFSWGFRVAAALDKRAARQDPPAAARNMSPDGSLNRAPLETVAGIPKPVDEIAIPLEEADWSAAEAIAEKSGSFALLIWQGGALRHERYWNGATAESRPEPASMAKTVLALAIGQAVADGKLRGLDAPVSTQLHEWRNDPRGRITLRQLLQMSSGLSPLPRDGGAQSPASRFHAGDGMVAMMLGEPQLHAPGTWFEYQNASSQLACLVLERATGQRYAQYLSRTLWQPIGAADASVWLDVRSEHPRCYASLYARPRDWLRIGLLLKDRGQFGGRKIVKRRWIDDMTRPSPTNPNYGLQLWRAAPHAPKRYYNQQREGFAATASAPSLAPDLFFLDGFGGQRVYVSRSADLVIVRLGRSDDGWDDSALPNAVVRTVGERSGQH